MLTIGGMSITKIYLCETTVAFDRVLLLDRKTDLYSNQDISEFIFIYEGCPFFLKKNTLKIFLLRSLENISSKDFFKNSKICCSQTYT